MIVQKGEKIYDITERKEYWSVVWKSGGLTAEFKVSKEICDTVEALREYILREESFS